MRFAIADFAGLGIYARVKWQGFRRLGLWPEGMFWAIKPLVVGLLPTGLAEGLKDRYYGRRDKNL